MTPRLLVLLIAFVRFKDLPRSKDIRSLDLLKGWSASLHYEAYQRKIASGCHLASSSEPVELVLTVGTKVVRTAMEMILPKGLGKVIKLESLKVRFRSRYFDFVVGQSQVNVHFSLDPSGPPQELAPLHEWARVVLLFAEAIKEGSAVYIVIHSHGQVWVQNALAMHDRLLSPEVLKVAEAVQDAWLVAERLGIQDAVRAPIAELL